MYSSGTYVSGTTLKSGAASSGAAVRFSLVSLAPLPPESPAWAPCEFRRQMLAPFACSPCRRKTGAVVELSGSPAHPRAHIGGVLVLRRRVGSEGLRAVSFGTTNAAWDTDADIGRGGLVVWFVLI